MPLFSIVTKIFTTPSQRWTRGKSVLRLFDILGGIHSKVENYGFHKHDFDYFRFLPDICHWNSVVPKLHHFWRYCVLPEILGRWYTQKRNVPQPSSGLSSVCFCRMNTTDAVVTCSNQACPISSFHLTCLKVQKVPKKWFSPLCQKTAVARNDKLKGKQIKKIGDEALKLDCICVCKKKPLPSDKLLKCHNPLCENGQFFHLACLNFKRMSNNALTTWECMGCISGGKGKPNTKEAKEQRTLQMHASQIMRMSL